MPIHRDQRNQPTADRTHTGRLRELDARLRHDHAFRVTRPALLDAGGSGLSRRVLQSVTLKS